jgi:hypothetical protein
VKNLTILRWKKLSFLTVLKESKSSLNLGEKPIFSIENIGFKQSACFSRLSMDEIRHLSKELNEEISLITK